MSKSILQSFCWIAPLTLTLSLTVAAGDWPQWRGPFRTGHAAPGEPVLQALPAAPKFDWKIKAGPGLASPVVTEKVAVLFDAAGQKEVLRAVDRQTGKEIWSREIDDTFHDSQGPDGPRCTPLIDGNLVFAVSCRGQLDCRSLEDGKKIWGVNFSDFGVEFIGEKGTAPGAIRHGNNGTPLASGDRLFVSVGGEGAGVVCFEKKTGQVLWKSQDDPAAYAPPMLIPLAGAQHLVCFTAEGLIGLNPENGELWWRVPIKTAYARHVTAPVWHNDVVVVSSHQAGMIATKISKEGAGFKAGEAWTSKDTAMNFSSPVAVDGYLYGLGPRKNLIAVEIATGKQTWSRDGYFHTSADKAYAGFLVLGQNILSLTDGGQLVLFKADPKQFTELGALQVAGLNWCNPAYADGHLFLRDGIRQNGGDWMSINLRTE